MSEPTEPRMCCHIPCAVPAAFTLRTIRLPIRGVIGIAGPDPYCDETDSCEAHVGALLGWQPGCVNTDEIGWQVMPL